ncbi:MAG: SWIM zinc finger family protein, partial [Methanosphaera sp.]|nr:SWIM zinc finger family protein [Methanosphaera sp.]
MSDWEELFDWQILERGYDYYCMDNIESIYRMEDTFYAVVSGTYDYNVEVTLDDEDNVINTYCDCPYGYNCKHAACVCYHLEDEYVKNISTSSQSILFDDVLTGDEFEKYLEEELSQYEFKELKSFIIELIHDDDNIYRKLIHKKDNLSDNDLTIFKKRLNGLLN